MASEDSEDEMLKAAIKASLEEAQSDPNFTQSSSMVDLTNDSGNDSDVQVVFPKSNSVIGSDTDDEASEEEDDDLKLALALSMGKSPPKIEKSPKVSPEKKNLDVKEPARDQPNTQGFMGLDRKKMEQERLMRLGKRKASAVDSESDRPVKAAKASPSQSFSIGSTSKHVSPGTGNWVEWDPDFNKSVSGPLPTSTSISHKRRGMQWPTGTVKKTQLTSSPRKHNEVSLEEILQKDDLELAVLSSFLWDMEWVLKKLDTKRTRMLFVVHAPNEAVNDPTIFFERKMGILTLYTATRI